MSVSYQKINPKTLHLDYARTLRLDLEYDGTAYYGWQRQAHQDTVQAKLEDALSLIAQEKVVLFFASRTDAGVHARHQVASFSLRRSQALPRAFMNGGNALLPKDIRILRVTEVPLEFHANRDVKSKIYRYMVWNNRRESVFARKHAWWIRSPLDVSRMKEASKSLLGEHDFSAFRTDKPETRSSIRTIHKIRIGKITRSLLYIEIEADGFLRHMVRNIAGVLVEVGLSKRPTTDVTKILQSKKRSEGGVCAPATGLFLWKVIY